MALETNAGLFQCFNNCSCRNEHTFHSKLGLMYWVAHGVINLYDGLFILNNWMSYRIRTLIALIYSKTTILPVLIPDINKSTRLFPLLDPNLLFWSTNGALNQRDTTISSMLSKTTGRNFKGKITEYI